MGTFAGVAFCVALADTIGNPGAVAEEFPEPREDRWRTRAKDEVPLLFLSNGTGTPRAPLALAAVLNR